jgi:predicted O-methyltransferase YrrM
MIIEPRVESYMASLDAQPDPVLAAMEALAERRRFPIVGRQAGSLMAMLARLMGARRVLEMGSGYGYSALWFARAMPEDGRVTCTDLSGDNRDLAMGYFRTAGLEKKIEFHVGDALQIARAQRGGFDIIFNDIDKHDYPASVEVAVALLRPGGLFITDNALWSGKVADEEAKDPTTEAVRLFNRTIFARSDLESVILPVHDGLAVCRKK